MALCRVDGKEQRYRVRGIASQLLMRSGNIFQLRGTPNTEVAPLYTVVHHTDDTMEYPQPTLDTREAVHRLDEDGSRYRDLRYSRFPQSASGGNETHRPSLLPIEWISELQGSRVRRFCLFTLEN